MRLLLSGGKATLSAGDSSSEGRRAAMRMFAGLDVGFKRTAMCVLDEAGRIVWRGMVDTHPEALSRALQHWGEKLAKIGLESGSMTPWLARELAKVGFPVVCMDARGGGCGQEPAGEIGQGGCPCAGRDAADRVVPHGVCEVGRQSQAEGHAGGARSVGASQTCARQSGARSTAAVWHSTAVAARD